MLQQSLVAIAILEFQETPNPNAVKCITDRVLAVKPRSYFTPASAQADPLARRLFEIPGVTHLLFVNEWLTVSKSLGAPWKDIKPAVRRALMLEE